MCAPVCGGPPTAPRQLDDVGVVQAPGGRRGPDDLAQLREVHHPLLAPPLIVEPGTTPRGRSERRRRVRLDLGSTSPGSAGSHQVEKLRCPTISAPVSARSRPAPPKWSGWLCVTTTVCTRRKGARRRPVERSAPTTTRAPEDPDRRGPGRAGPRARSSSRGRAPASRWELEPQDTRADLGHLGRRRLLLLTQRGGRSHGVRIIAATSSLPAGGRPARNLSHRARLDGSRDDGTGSRS